MNEEKRILISSREASLYFVAELHRGIRRFARTRPDWNIGWIHTQIAGDDKIRKALHWKPHGILILEKSTIALPLLDCREGPVVAVDLHHDQPAGCSRIEVDSEALGREVARYFLQNRFQHFAVVVWPHNPPFSALREQGFTRTVSESGWHTDRFESEVIKEQPWDDHSVFEHWLLHLPKPVALFAVQHELAQRVLQCCKRLGIQIPLELSLVGLDAQDDFVDGKRPFISYIRQPLEEAGFQAAQRLDELLQRPCPGAGLTPVIRRIPPASVVERQSSSLRAIPDPSVAKAAQVLWEKALTGVRIAEAVRISGMNRRTLERAFRTHLGLSPGEFIRELKIEHAKKLLTETDLRVWEIADACGLTQEHFITVFRETAGMTPNRYRTEKRNRQH